MSAIQSPEPDAIRAARIAADLTQTEAGALVHTTYQVWQQWEHGKRAMHPAFWELFGRKVAERPTSPGAAATRAA
jgi:DNA-binding transcriptional regulator YiaG